MLTYPGMRLSRSTQLIIQEQTRKIKRHVTTSQQKHKKIVQPQFLEIKQSSIEVNSSTSCEFQNHSSFNQTDF